MASVRSSNGSRPCSRQVAIVWCLTVRLAEQGMFITVEASSADRRVFCRKEAMRIVTNATSRERFPQNARHKMSSRPWMTRNAAPVPGEIEVLQDMELWTEVRRRMHCR